MALSAWRAAEPPAGDGGEQAGSPGLESFAIMKLTVTGTRKKHLAAFDNGLHGPIDNAEHRQDGCGGGQRGRGEIRQPRAPHLLLS